MSTSRTRFFFSWLILVISLTGLSAVANAQPSTPSAEKTEQARRDGPCRDPWVTIALKVAKAGFDRIEGVGDLGECNYQQYGGGSWNSFQELYGYVDEALRKQREQNVGWVKAAIGNGNFNIDLKDLSTRENLWHIVAAGGGNVVANDGAGIVAAGGGNHTGGGSNYRIAGAEGARRVIDLGKSVIIIKR